MSSLEVSRQPLSSIENSVTSKENEMVGRQKVASGSRKTGDSNKTPDKPGPTSSKSATNKVRNGFITKRKYADKGIQTENPNIDLVTGEEAPLAYWKELAETRRQALHEALEENEGLHRRVEELQKENNVLEEMVQEAKNLAEIITSISGDDNPDESGFGTEGDNTGYEHDLLSP